MSRRRVPVFYIVLICFTVVFLLALAVFLFVVRSYLYEYESVQPYKVVERTIDDYFLAEDKEPLLEKSEYEIPDFTSKSNLISYLDEMLSDDNITYYSVSAEHGADYTFAVVSNDLKIAYIDLTECLDKSERGFSQYILSDIRLAVGASSAINIKAPSDATVFVNGRPVEASYISGEPEMTASCDHMYGDAKGISYVTYKIDGLFGTPDITARSKDGYSLEVISKDDKGIFYEVPVSYAEPSEELLAMILDAAESYAAYMQKDAPFNKIAKYLDRTSDLYTDLRTSEVKWVNEHSGYYIEDTNLSELFFYDENTFSCRVSFVHVLYGGWGGNYNNDFDMTFYFRQIGGAWLIYDSQVN